MKGLVKLFGAFAASKSGHGYEHLAASVSMEMVPVTSITRNWPAAGQLKRTRIARPPVTAENRAVRICAAMSRWAE